MLYAVIIDDEEKEKFFPEPVQEDAGEVDILIGLVDEETDTACGVLGAEAMPEEDERFALELSFLRIAPGFENLGGEKIMMDLLLDLAGALGSSAVHVEGAFWDGADNDTENLLLELGFYAEDNKLSLFTFSLADLSIKDIRSDMGCFTLSDLKDDQWESFVTETGDRDFYLMPRSTYEQDLSVFLVDDEEKVCAGALISQVDDRLFVDAVAAYGSDEEALINDLMFWSCEGARKRFPSDTQVGIFMPKGKVYRDILMKATKDKAKTSGKLLAYTYECPVS